MTWDRMMPMTELSEHGPTGAVAARRQLARILLEREVGQRLPSTQILQQETGLGAGTVVKALRELQRVRAATLKARGHRGTTIEGRHVGKLWAAAGLGTFILVMPPPGPLEQQAAQEAVRGAMNRLAIASSVEYVSGAAARLEEVYQGRAHAALMSAGAFQELSESMPGIVGVDLGAGSYYAPGTLVKVTRRDAVPSGRPRVAIDHSSHDHAQLTEAVFGGAGYEPLECHFYEVPARVLAGEVDSGIWHSMPTVIPPDLAGLTLTPLEEAGVPNSQLDLHGVVVSMSVDAATNAALREVRLREVAQHYQDFMRAATGDGTRILWPR